MSNPDQPSDLSSEDYEQLALREARENGDHKEISELMNESQISGEMLTIGPGQGVSQVLLEYYSQPTKDGLEVDENDARARMFMMLSRLEAANADIDVVQPGALEFSPGGIVRLHNAEGVMVQEVQLEGYRDLAMEQARDQRDALRAEIEFPVLEEDPEALASELLAGTLTVEDLIREVEDGARNWRDLEEVAAHMGTLPLSPDEELIYAELQSAIEALRELDRLAVSPEEAEAIIAERYADIEEWFRVPSTRPSHFSRGLQGASQEIQEYQALHPHLRPSFADLDALMTAPDTAEHGFVMVSPESLPDDIKDLFPEEYWAVIQREVESIIVTPNPGRLLDPNELVPTELGLSLGSGVVLMSTDIETAEAFASTLYHEASHESRGHLRGESYRGGGLEEEMRAYTEQLEFLRDVASARPSADFQSEINRAERTLERGRFIQNELLPDFSQISSVHPGMPLTGPDLRDMGIDLNDLRLHFNDKLTSWSANPDYEPFIEELRVIIQIGQKAEKAMELRSLDTKYMDVIRDNVLSLLQLYDATGDTDYLKQANELGSIYLEDLAVSGQDAPLNITHLGLPHLEDWPHIQAALRYMPSGVVGSALPHYTRFEDAPEAFSMPDGMTIQDLVTMNPTDQWMDDLIQLAYDTQEAHPDAMIRMDKDPFLVMMYYVAGHNVIGRQRPGTTRLHIDDVQLGTEFLFTYMTLNPDVNQDVETLGVLIWGFQILQSNKVISTKEFNAYTNQIEPFTMSFPIDVNNARRAKSRDHLGFSPTKIPPEVETLLTP